MNKYTILPEGDNVVAKDMQKLSRLDIFPFSLILFGSFGRGEGLVLDGKPRNDYDLLLVHGTERDKKLIEQTKLSCMPEVHMIDLEALGKSAITQQIYEIRYGSQVILGESVDGVIGDPEPYEIPYGDAINSLERRAISMILAKYELGKQKSDLRKVTEQIAKMVIALGDAILIKRGQFNPKYANRNLLLSNDDISSQYQLAVSTKLTGTPELSEDQLWNWWHNTRHMLREYAVGNSLKLTIGEALFAITDRTTQEQLKDILIKLGAKKWL